jgi:hypothetical protein
VAGRGKARRGKAGHGPAWYGLAWHGFIKVYVLFLERIVYMSREIYGTAKSGTDYHIKTSEDGYFMLIKEILNRANDDYECFKSGTVAVSMGGRGRNKKTYKNLLKVNPIKEWNESFVLQITRDYYNNLNKKERSQAV